MKTQIDVNAIKACLISAGKKDVRYYLNGVMVRPRAQDVVCVGTDGHRMTVARSTVDGYAGATFDLIIPRDKAELAVKAADKGQGTLCLETDGSGYRLNGIPFMPIDGKFADWQRVVPQIKQEEIAQYNPVYLLDAVKSIGAYQGISAAKAALICKLYQNGNSGAIVRSENPDCFVVVMPMRVKDLSVNANDSHGWVTDPVPLKAMQ